MMFVSYSGQQGEHIARVIRELVSESFREVERSVEIVFSPVAQPVGGAWRVQLDDLLAICDFGLLVLDARALHSPWVAYEAGALAARQRSGSEIRLFPLVLSDTPDVVNGTPYDSFECALLTASGFEKLFDSLLRATGEALPRATVRALAYPAFNQVSTVWAQIRNEESRSGEAFLGSLRELTARFASFSLVNRTDIIAYEHLLSVARTEFSSVGTSLLRELGDIARLFADCSKRSESDFGALATEWAIKKLILDTKEQLGDIGHGRLPVKNRAPVREFWLESIFGRACASVWTTNVATPGANMGGSPDQQLLAAQEAAIERGVQVTRVFVYNSAMSPNETTQRRDLMRRQIDIGIEVRVITEQDFRTRSDIYNAKRKIGSDDFMIIDDKFIYLTTPDQKDDIEATLFDGKQHHARLTAARLFRGVLDDWADVVTKENVDRFPKLPG